MNASQNSLRNMLLVVAACLMLAVSLLLMAGATHAWFTASITSKNNTITAAESWAVKPGQLTEPEEPAEEPVPQPDEETATIPGESEPAVPESPTTPGEPEVPAAPEEPAETDEPESSQPADPMSSDNPADALQPDASGASALVMAASPQGE